MQNRDDRTHFSFYKIPLDDILHPIVRCGIRKSARAKQRNLQFPALRLRPPSVKTVPVPCRLEVLVASTGEVVEMVFHASSRVDWEVA